MKIYTTTKNYVRSVFPFFNICTPDHGVLEKLRQLLKYPQTFHTIVAKCRRFSIIHSINGVSIIDQKTVVQQSVVPSLTLQIKWKDGDINGNMFSRKLYNVFNITNIIYLIIVTTYTPWRKIQLSFWYVLWVMLWI